MATTAGAGLDGREEEEEKMVVGVIEDCTKVKHVVDRYQCH